MNAVISMSGIGMRLYWKAPCVVRAISAAYLPASAPNISRPRPKITSAAAKAAAADGITAVNSVTYPTGHDTRAMSQARRIGLL